MNEWEQEFTKRQLEGVERQEREKKREEQWQREEEERERLGLYWDNPQGDAYCAGFNTRHYSARLMNTVSYNYNWLKPCLEIPLVIHGRDVKASRCEIQVTSFIIGVEVMDLISVIVSRVRALCMDIGPSTSTNLFVRPIGINLRIR